MTEVEKLIDKMADKLFTAFRPYVSDGMCDVMAKELLKEVLSEIKNGGVVEACDCVFNLGEDCKECDGDGFILKPEFEKFLNEGKP